MTDTLLVFDVVLTALVAAKLMWLVYTRRRMEARIVRLLGLLEGFAEVLRDRRDDAAQAIESGLKRHTEEVKAAVSSVSDQTAAKVVAVVEGHASSKSGSELPTIRGDK